jgi:putative transposase
LTPTRCGALAPLHARHFDHVRAREHHTGHFWQGRFGSVTMDEEYLGAALRHVAFNPVRAKRVERATDWRWSNVHPQLGTVDDGITCTALIRERFPDFAAFLIQGEDLELSNHLRHAEMIGRPIGSSEFLAEC